MTEVENQTLRLLRELRTAIEATESRLSQKIQTLTDETTKRLVALEKAQERFRVRQAVMETRQNELAGDLAAIARIVARAKEFDENRS